MLTPVSKYCTFNDRIVEGNNRNFILNHNNLDSSFWEIYCCIENVCSSKLLCVSPSVSKD